MKKVISFDLDNFLYRTNCNNFKKSKPNKKILILGFLIYDIYIDVKSLFLKNYYEKLRIIY